MLTSLFIFQLNENEAKRGHRVMALTPRHFLDFIKHYINIFHEKRRDLEEEKLHLNIGLSKVLSSLNFENFVVHVLICNTDLIHTFQIRETEEQVLELQKSLTLKSSELETKKAAANAKLKVVQLEKFFKFIVKGYFLVSLYSSLLIVKASLQEMLADQQRAEKEKLASEQLQKELAESLVEIEKKRAEVQEDLAQVKKILSIKLMNHIWRFSQVFFRMF